MGAWRPPRILPHAAAPRRGPPVDPPEARTPARQSWRHLLAVPGSRPHGTSTRARERDRPAGTCSTDCSRSCARSTSTSRRRQSPGSAAWRSPTGARALVDARRGSMPARLGRGQSRVARRRVRRPRRAGAAARRAAARKPRPSSTAGSRHLVVGLLSRPSKVVAREKARAPTPRSTAPRRRGGRARPAAAQLAAACAGVGSLQKHDEAPLRTITRSRPPDRRGRRAGAAPGGKRRISSALDGHARDPPRATSPRIRANSSSATIQLEAPARARHPRGHPAAAGRSSRPSCTSRSRRSRPACNRSASLPADEPAPPYPNLRRSAVSAAIDVEPG